MIFSIFGASQVAQRIKRLPAMQETGVRPLGWEDPLEKEMAAHSSILAWRIPWTEEPGGPRKESDTTEWLHFHFLSLVYSQLCKQLLLLFSCSVVSNSFATPWTVACQAPLSIGISQARILEWVAISFSRGSSWPRNWACVSCVGRWILYHWATREAHANHVPNSIKAMYHNQH